MDLDKFFTSNPRAIKDTFEEVNSKYSIVKFDNGDWDDDVWAMIDVNFFNGHIFGVKTTKQAAIDFINDWDK